MSNRPLLSSAQPSSERQGMMEATSDSPTRASAEKPRRKIITAACDSCRKKKTRCNGARPICSACLTRNTPCEYDVEAGETRVQSLRSKKESLEKALASMLEVLWALRSGSQQEVEATVAHIRGDPDFQAALDIATQSAGRGSSAGGSSSVASALPAIALPQEAAEAQARLDIDRPIQKSLQLAIGESRKSSQSSTAGLTVSGTTASTRTSVSIHPTESFLELPDKDTAHMALMSYYSCGGKLFHVFAKEQGINIWRDVYERGEKNNPVRLAEMFGILAIGLQCSNDDTFAGLCTRSYHFAKSFLEDVLEADRLQATKVIVCLAMYNIMNKSTVALSYIELGMSITRRYGLHQRIRPVHMQVETWWEMKRVWRTLMFLESWLTSTLGYMSEIPSSLSMDELLQEMEIPSDVGSNMYDMVQAEMAKISLLTASVTRALYASDTADMQSVSVVTADLRKWHQNLRFEMQLSSPNIEPELLMPIHFVHMVYYGALMLVYRRVMFHAAQRDDLLSFLAEGDIYQQVSVHREEGVDAARSTARILARLHNDDLLFKRCWLVTFHAFTGALVILHNIAARTSRGVGYMDVKEDFKLLEICLGILDFAADLDPAAKHFLDTVTPYYEFLASLKGISTGFLHPRSQMFRRASAPKDLPSATQSLTELVRQPFGNMDPKRRASDSQLLSHQRFTLFYNSILPPLPKHPPLPMTDRFRLDVPSPFNAPDCPHVGPTSHPEFDPFTPRVDFGHVTGGAVPNAMERMGWRVPHTPHSYFDSPPSMTSTEQPWMKRRRTEFVDPKDMDDRRHSTTQDPRYEQLGESHNP